MVAFVEQTAAIQEHEIEKNDLQVSVPVVGCVRLKGIRDYPGSNKLV